MTRKYLEFVLRESDEEHLEKLPLIQSEPIRLIHSGLSYEAAAAQLGIPVNTLKTRVHRGRDKVTTMRAALVASTMSQDQLEAADD